MTSVIFLFLLVLGIQFYHVSIFNKWNPTPHTFLYTVKRISKLFIHYKTIFISLAAIGALDLYLKIYPKNSFISSIIFTISLIITLRFILKIVYELEFESFLDMSFSLIFIFISLNYLDQKFIFSNQVNKLFLLETQSYVLQLFIFHLLILLLLFIILIAYIMVAVGVYLGIKYFFAPFFNNEIKFWIDLIQIITKYTSKLLDLINIYFNINLKKFINFYVNPFKGIKLIKLHKNTHLIKIILVLTYVITGIFIIYYWNDLKYYIYNSNEIFGYNLNFISEEMYNLEIPPTNFDNYRLIFILPLVSIYFNKWLQKKDTSQ